MTTVCNADVETRSMVDLTKCGTMRYATDPSTMVLCFDFHWRGQRFMFNPAANRDKALAFIVDLHKSGDMISAFNWTFEYAIMAYVCTRLYDWPYFPPERFVCTRAQGLRWGLPGNLEGASGYVGEMRKDLEGNRIMLQLTKPRRPRKGEDVTRVHWFGGAERFERLQRYNRDDVLAEASVARTAPPLSKWENRVFRMDQQINLRGIACDVALAHGAESVFADYVEDVKRQVPAKAWSEYFTALTQRDKVRRYIEEDRGIPMPNMQAPTLERLQMLSTDKKLLRVLNAYLESRGQSINKYRAMLAHEHGGRLYMNLQFCGASATGRWSGQGVQLHNMNRPTVEYDPRIIKAIKSGSYKKCLKMLDKVTFVDPDETRDATVADLLKSSIRSMLVPDEGMHFAVNDYSAIEARMVFMLSGCETGLSLYRTGQDPYRWLGAQIYDVDIVAVNKEQRFVGKQGILGLGYGMGAPRFMDQCEGYGRVISRGLAEKAKNTYRQRFREVPRMWQALEIAFRRCIFRKRSAWIDVGLIAYRWEKGNVLCRFPSGTVLTYHRPKISLDDRIMYKGVARTGQKHMVTRDIWGGTLLENVCQGLSRDLMAGAMLRLERAGFPCALTVHDELVNQVPAGKSNKKVQRIILDLERWARDFPIEIEGEIVDRYRKV